MRLRCKLTFTLVHLRLLSTSSVQSKLNQEELDLLLKPALILKPPLNAHLLLLLDLGEELLVNDSLLQLLSAALDQYFHHYLHDSCHLCQY